MNTEKTVSIIMGTYNGAKYIREQLDSILAQTYPLKEIIIQDDGSTDDTMDIVRQYAKQYPIIRITQNELGKGINNNFFSAIRKAQGEYVANSLKDYLMRHPEMDMRCSKHGTCHYLTTESAEKFRESAQLFLNEDIDVERVVLG